ncbi:tyrosine-type recombinase/integrase [Pleurocapsales cyanobacterium LEGE 10410]|nr:tyrosine-type recombinase/integrase [Pleurocapsales cyanobacterium LEGE 10410]
MKSTSEILVSTKNSINYRDNFAQFLTESERSTYTIKNYLCDLDGFAAWLKSKGNREFTPELITPTDLREYKHHLDETLQLKPKTINRKLSSLRSFLNWAGIEGYFSDNRLPHIPLPIKEQANAPKWLDRLDQHALCRIVEKGRKTRDIAIVILLLNTGLRVSELCTLTWKDIRITTKKGCLSVNHGKGAKRRIVPLNKDSDRRVFIGQRGAMTPRGIESTLKKYVKQTDLEGISPHQLRHTFCKNLIDAGVSLEKVATLAGHDNLETTRRYCTPSEQDLAAAVELIGEED